MATNKKRISSYISDEVYEKFIKEAKRQGRTASNLLAFIVKEYLDNK